MEPKKPTLNELLESARKHVMTPEEREAQRQSWVRGEMALAEQERGMTPVFPSSPRPAEAGTAEQLAKHVVDECLGKYPDDDREFTDLERDIASLIRPHLRAAAVPSPPSDDTDEVHDPPVTVIGAAEQFPMSTLADALCNACQLLDSVKSDWQKDGCWSEWDQNVRDALSRELKKWYEAAPPCEPPNLTKLHQRILAAIMDSLIEQKAPDSVSGYKIMDAVLPHLEAVPAPPEGGKEGK